MILLLVISTNKFRCNSFEVQKSRKFSLTCCFELSGVKANLISLFNGFFLTPMSLKFHLIGWNLLEKACAKLGYPDCNYYHSLL